jgi:uncharacterized protein YndB with AHSA1/START domain
MFDVQEQINGVHRTVGSRVLEAGEARTVTVSQTYDATIDDVWDACTNAERIPRWFLPITGELRLGGRYQLEGNAGGTIERCDPPKSFAATWEFDGGVSWIELRLTPESGDRTRFELDHIALPDDERWREFGPGAVGIGWELGIMGLARHLTGSGVKLSPEDAAAWMVTPEARELMTLSGQRWCDADIASGTDEADARARSDRTIAAYTAPPPDAAV